MMSVEATSAGSASATSSLGEGSGVPGGVEGAVCWVEVEDATAVCADEATGGETVKRPMASPAINPASAAAMGTKMGFTSAIIPFFADGGTGRAYFASAACA